MDYVGIRGRVSAVLRDKSGEVQHRIEKDNQVVENGFYTLARCLVGNQDPPDFWFKVGNDNRETEEDMDELQGDEIVEAEEKAEVTQDGEEVSVNLKITFSEQFDIGELGICTERSGDKELFARVNLNPAVVAMADWEIEMEWALYIGRS